LKAVGGTSKMKCEMNKSSTPFMKQNGSTQGIPRYRRWNFNGKVSLRAMNVLGKITYLW